MTAAILIPVVFGIIFLARAKLGDATYDQIVVAIFKWLFISVAAVFAVLYVANHL